MLITPGGQRVNKEPLSHPSDCDDARLFLTFTLVIGVYSFCLLLDFIQLAVCLLD